MFADSLFDSRLKQDSRRWTTVLSFGLQALAVAALLTLPFLSTQGLPQLSLLTHLMVPVSQPSAPVVAQAASRIPSTSSSAPTIVVPRNIPAVISMTDDSNSAPPNLPIGQSNTNTTDRGFPPGVTNSIGDAAAPVLVAAPAAHPRVSVMMEGNLIYRVQPQYPPIAMQARISGPVVLHAVISRQGNIENLQVISGHSMLVRAALEAVRQWRYRPYTLNGESVEVDTQVTVNFVLGGR